MKKILKVASLALVASALFGIGLSDVVASASYTATTQNVRYEAEEYVYDGTRVKVSPNTAASGGYMVADINDCGQGIGFAHYAPVAGTYTLEIAYWTGSAGSKHGVYVDGIKQATAIYSTATGWANGVIEAAKLEVEVNLNKGYNSISLIKDGIESDNPTYGGWAQVDYVEVKGGHTYNPYEQSYVNYSIKIEAELGYLHGGAYLPVLIPGASNNYICGEINAEGNGSDLSINIKESGTYELRIVYGKNNDARPININLDGTNYTYSLQDFEGNAFNVFGTSDVAATLELDETKTHKLSITRAANSNWFCFDSIILTKVTPNKFSASLVNETESLSNHIAVGLSNDTVLNENYESVAVETDGKFGFDNNVEILEVVEAQEPGAYLLKSDEGYLAMNDTGLYVETAENDYSTWFVNVENGLAFVNNANGNNAEVYLYNVTSDYYLLAADLLKTNPCLNDAVVATSLRERYECLNEYYKAKFTSSTCEDGTTTFEERLSYIELQSGVSSNLQNSGLLSLTLNNTDNISFILSIGVLAIVIITAYYYINKKKFANK